MLTFWNMAGVPLSYCHCALYIANHHPDEYRWSTPALLLLVVAYLFFYWMWDTANSQKNGFRQMERKQLLQRKTFPQLPWQVIENPKVLETNAGDRIMVDGWFAIIRKPNYVPDIFFSFSWGLITGFKYVFPPRIFPSSSHGCVLGRSLLLIFRNRSPFPWFYFVFFTAMIIHRTQRDVDRCRRKYGDAWKRYEEEVPYLFIPVRLS